MNKWRLDVSSWLLLVPIFIKYTFSVPGFIIMSLAHLHKPARESNGLSLHYLGEYAIIVMDRGENRLNLEFMEIFMSFLDEVEKNESCKGLITTGKGKFYSNGLDLEWMGQETADNLILFGLKMMEVIKKILFYPLPTIAAINGHCFAGGALMAFAHDFRAMKTGGRGWICLNEVFINRTIPKHSLLYLRAKIGSGKNLSDVVVLGQRFTAEEAFGRGLVHAMPSENMLITESIRILKTFHGKTGYPRDSLVSMKKDVYSDALEALGTSILEIKSGL